MNRRNDQFAELSGKAILVLLAAGVLIVPFYGLMPLVMVTGGIVVAGAVLNEALQLEPAFATAGKSKKKKKKKKKK
jgi:hypothetical protein